MTEHAQTEQEDDPQRRRQDTFVSRARELLDGQRDPDFQEMRARRVIPGLHRPAIALSGVLGGQRRLAVTST